MFQKLGDHIANCLARAADAERRAAEASSEDMRVDNERMAKTWRHLADSYQFVDSLERFLLKAEEAEGARPPEPPIETEVSVFAHGTTLDPQTIALLTATYHKAISGQPAAVHEIIAKRIIELASKGERDPDKLCLEALALSKRELDRLRFALVLR
jgi:hypothetical protein